MSSIAQRIAARRTADSQDLLRGAEEVQALFQAADEYLVPDFAGKLAHHAQRLIDQERSHLLTIRGAPKFTHARAEEPGSAQILASMSFDVEAALVMMAGLRSLGAGRLREVPPKFAFGVAKRVLERVEGHRWDFAPKLKGLIEGNAQARRELQALLGGTWKISRYLFQEAGVQAAPDWKRFYLEFLVQVEMAKT